MPCIAVHSFQDPSDRGDAGVLARGFVEDLVTELGRFANLEVLAPGVASGRTGEEDDVPPCRLQVDYDLAGTVRRVGEAVRITARVSEADSGRIIWTERYDASAQDLLATQDEIVARVAALLAIRVDDTELARARRRPLSSLEVYECWVRGLDHLKRGTVEDDQLARGLFERALEDDPGFARAWVGLSLTHFNEWSCQAWESWDEKERRAFEAAHQAAKLDTTDALAQIILGRIRVYRREFDEGGRHVERALRLNPNDADVVAHASLCLSFLGEAGRAASLAERAMTLHPCPPDWYGVCLGMALFLTGRYEEALVRTSGFGRPAVDFPAWLAAAHALTGDLQRAGDRLAEFLQEFEEKVTFGRPPEAGEPLRWILHVNPFRRQEDAETLARGLALAGLAPDPDAGRVAIPVRSPSAPAEIRRVGEHWRVSFEGLTVLLAPVKGFGDLATLLSQPGREVHCLELAGRPAEGGTGTELLDPQARREIGERVQALQEELDEAEAAGDRGRAGAARQELEALASELGRALGLGGRSRRTGSAAERARSTVTWRIRSAVRKIGAAHNRLGRHLENSIRTGTFCAYCPETPVVWVT